MLKQSFAMIVASVALVACSFDQAGLPASDETLHQRLGVREALLLEPESDIAIKAVDGNGNLLPELDPAVRGGNAVLRSTDTGLLLVEKLDIYLSDVRVPPDVIYSEPVDLTDIEVRLGTQLVVEAEWDESGQWAAGTGTADLLLDWAVRARNGDVLPLATQRLRDVEFHVYAAVAADGTVVAFVDAHLDGHIRSFGNRVELSDLALNVTARSPLPIVD
jgi:hypothetical protein